MKDFIDFIDEEKCLRKANQEWEMAGLARIDGDRLAEKRHTEQARLWDERASEGGYYKEI